MRVSLRPDPSKGVFETMLVLGGRPVEFEAHLERLGESVAALYARRLPVEASETALRRAAPVEHGKLRLDVAPRLNGRLAIQAVTAEVEPTAVFPPASRAARLHSLAVPGGLGAHKWADRRLLEDAEEKLPRGELPLLVDETGALLEVSRASVFRVRGEEIRTPPLDGRILPSIARRRALAVARAAGIEVRETRMALADLLGGDEVFLSGSVRGIEPVASVDCEEIPAGGAVSSLVANALRRHWLPAPRAAASAGGADALPAGPLAR